MHSAPIYYKGVIYIGANDGMLHAFDATTGEELFAYVPNLVYDHLADLADPGYSHRFYVDNTATVANAGSQDLLVCGLRKGGKGYFALDVTSPAAMAASDVLWEFPPPADDDMGYSFSRAFIVKTKAAGYVAIFGNGYDSVNGEAVLYVLNAADGSVLKQFDTGVVGCNGLSTPAIVDMELDGFVDYAFAGDLKGNMWKFDLRGENITDWQFSYQNGATPMPLITVKQAGEVQPITAAPEVMLDCVIMAEGRGLMVIFGTGQYVNTDDFADTTVQSFYGIWDWGDMWEAKDDASVAKTKYLGTVNTDRSLSNVAGRHGCWSRFSKPRAPCGGYFPTTPLIGITRWIIRDPIWGGFSICHDRRTRPSATPCCARAWRFSFRRFHRVRHVTPAAVRGSTRSTPVRAVVLPTRCLMWMGTVRFLLMSRCHPGFQNHQAVKRLQDTVRAPRNCRSAVPSGFRRRDHTGAG